jgi:phenylpropionate dioxygenase-like ring-hydroxylating dioxygenase large terminal subunit
VTASAPQNTRRQGTRALPADADLAPLRAYWHPVAYSQDLDGEPMSELVLGEPVVLFRTEAGVHAFRDVCPHRGAKLSVGKLRDGRIVCPYHGFQYDGEGSCRFVPSQPPDQQKIPSRLRLERYDAAERCGIVWVALEPPRQPIPTFPEFDAPRFHVHTSPVETWDASAARWMENYLDITHFPHVHPGILGDPGQPVCKPYEVHETPTGLVYEYEALAQFDPTRWPKPENQDAIDVEPSRFRTELFLPFTVAFTNLGDDGTWVAFTAGLPMTADRVRFFTVQARDYLLDMPDDAANELSHVIAEQDRSVTENQHPEMLPIDLTEEVHLRVGDAIGIAYRRRLRELGLTYA